MGRFARSGVAPLLAEALEFLVHRLERFAASAVGGSFGGLLGAVGAIGDWFARGAADELTQRRQRTQRALRGQNRDGKNSKNQNAPWKCASQTVLKNTDTREFFKGPPLHEVADSPRLCCVRASYVLQSWTRPRRAFRNFSRKNWRALFPFRRDFVFTKLFTAIEFFVTRLPNHSKFLMLLAARTLHRCACRTLELS